MSNDPIPFVLKIHPLTSKNPDKQKSPVFSHQGFFVIDFLLSGLICGFDNFLY